MCKTFVNCNGPLIEKLEKAVLSQEVVNMETEFCSVSLDIIGKSVFNLPRSLQSFKRFIAL